MSTNFEACIFVCKSMFYILGELIYGALNLLTVKKITIIFNQSFKLSIMYLKIYLDNAIKNTVTANNLLTGSRQYVWLRLN